MHNYCDQLYYCKIIWLSQLWLKRKQKYSYNAQLESRIIVHFADKFTLLSGKRGKVCAVFFRNFSIFPGMQGFFVCVTSRKKIMISLLIGTGCWLFQYAGLVPCDLISLARSVSATLLSKRVNRGFGSGIGPGRDGLKFPGICDFQPCVNCLGGKWQEWRKQSGKIRNPLHTDKQGICANEKVCFPGLPGLLRIKILVSCPHAGKKKLKCILAMSVF